MRIIDPEVPGHEQADGSFFSALTRETRFLFVRHGQSEGNARKIVQGLLDLPLDALGRVQAESLAPWIAEQAPKVVFASPLVRAAETASIIVACCNRVGANLPAPRLDPLFAELDVGPFTGLGMDESKKRHPEVFAAFRRQSWDGVPGAETSTSLYQRALGAWASLRAEALHGANCIVIVTHGGFIQWLIKSTMGMRSWMPLVKTSNCGISELVVMPQEQGEDPLLVWDRIDFLAPGIASSVPPLF